MKRFYYAVTVNYTGDRHYYEPSEDLTKEKYCSFVVSATEADNLLFSFYKWGKVMHVNAFATKKRAEEVAAFWNDCYKNNGTYALA